MENMKEFKVWLILSACLFAIAFIERVGRPLIYFAIAIFVVGILFWIDSDYKEYLNKPSTKKKEKEDTKQFEQTVKTLKKLWKL
jgi:hypothetical protein